MENVDEAAEARLVAEMKEIREREEADVVIIDEDQQVNNPGSRGGLPNAATVSSYHPSKERQAFLRHMHQRALSGEGASTSTGIPLKPLERAQSNPVIKLNYPRQPTPPQDTAPKPPPTTGIHTAWSVMRLGWVHVGRKNGRGKRRVKREVGGRVRRGKT